VSTSAGLTAGSRVRITGEATAQQAVAVLLALDRAARESAARRHPAIPPAWSAAGRLEAIAGVRATSPTDLRSAAGAIRRVIEAPSGTLDR